ncbi:MAG: DUF2461 domain-containing protein [Oscillospiraceae bacterium]|jgi:uncharacterized protein (TIGR02453 family)|nr:DUF2461 domain-containing protein [Oscillospiraceae bacterium]
MNTQMILDYLTELSANNNREWYHAHKAEYHAANGQFEELIQALILQIGEFDGSILGRAPRELTFKLVRDTRFSHDKSPYNPAFRAHISSMGKLPIPVGYYLMLKPGGQSFLGGGLFADMFKDATRKVRDYISEHGSEWEAIIAAPSFQERFTVGGSALKNVPAGYERDHPQAEHLKYKSWYLEYPIQDKDLVDSNLFLTKAADIFRLMKPFNDYLNSALAGFKMPAR